MRVVVQNTLTNRQWVAFEAPGGFTVGRDAGCDVKLESRFVSGTHVKVERAEANGASGWEVDVLPGVSAIEVNGTSVQGGQKVLFKASGTGGVLELMGFVLTLS